MSGGKWVHPAWKQLGIAPTGDTRAIRSAYAAKLKAIDPEQDPKAFIALREAFEAARVQAQWVDVPDEDEEEAWDDEADGEDWGPPGDLYQIRPAADASAPPPPDPAWESPAPPEPAPAEPPRASPWTPPSAEDADAHARALATLLYSHDREANPWPSPAQEAEMLAHWRAITADPRMQEVSYFADAERWFAELIARTAAFSDPLVVPATEYFHWLGSDGTITQSPAAAYLTRRYRMLEFQRSVKQAQHPLNTAWRELVRPAGPRPRRGMANGRKVRQLLRIVRTHYPDLEGCFDPERVALWDGTQISAGIGWNWIWAVFFFGFLLLRVFASIDEGRTPSLPPPVPVSELTSPAPDIDRALASIFGDGKLPLAMIEARNPRLHAALIDYWREEQPRYVSLAGFASDIEVYLTRWYYDGIRRASPALLAEHHRLSADMARALRSDSAACRAFLAGDRLWTERLGLPRSYYDRQKALVARAALEADGSEPYRGGEFSVPGHVVAAAEASAHMSDPAFAAALLYKGSDANQCAGLIALMETVLAMPPGKERTALMRHL